MQSVITIQNLTKRYGKHTILDDVSLQIEKGEIYGLIGRNGAGKTTLMKILLGLSKATSGSVQLLGKENLDDARLKTGSIIETPTFFDKKSVYKNMVYHAKLIGFKDYDKAIMDLLDMVGLKTEKNRPAQKLSLGMRQKLGIAMALMNQPEILILDEPINGLDPVAIAEVRRILKRINQDKGTTIFISSHILGEMQKLATKYGFLVNGKIVEEISEKDVEEKGIDLEEYSLKLMGVNINE